MLNITSALAMGIRQEHYSLQDIQQYFIFALHLEIQRYDLV